MVENVDYKPKIDLFTNIEQVSVQEVFDFVVEHLRKQGRPAKSEGGKCFYFDVETGNRCAVGCLISSDNYEERFEGVGVESIYGGNKIGLLQWLQGIHDDYKAEAWERKLKQVAIEYNLSYSPPVISLP